jgi:tetratricopeptide (TPR) repeat protein
MTLYNEEELMPFLSLDTNRFGLLNYYLGDYDQMEEDFQHSLKISQESKSEFGIQFALLMLGFATKRKGQLSRAADFCLTALEMSLEYCDNPSLIFACMDSMAGIAAAAGRSREAARLYGAAEGSFPDMVEARNPIAQLEFERDLASVRLQLGEEIFQVTFAEGRTLMLDQAIQELRDLGENLRNNPAN